MGLLETFIATQVFSFLIIFARIGTAIMIMPGLSDITVPVEIRLFFALTFCFILVPVLQPFLPAAMPAQPIVFGVMIVKEMLTGLFLGLMTQVMMIAINLAGVLVAHATSLSSAMTFNPQLSGQTTVVNTFFSILTVVMLFVTDLHHLLFMGFIDSYALFPTQNDLMLDDMSFSVAQDISEAMRIGLMISAPFVVVSFGVFIAMGLVARLVPQIQVFALSVPVQVLTGLVLLMTSISAMMLFFLDEYERFWKSFLES
ncbi:MAG: fliR [Alphaproteobacteria bacterium]|nr:fliR [Alphaproteobacteria bacterium]